VHACITARSIFQQLMPTNLLSIVEEGGLNIPNEHSILALAEFEICSRSKICHSIHLSFLHCSMYIWFNNMRHGDVTSDDVLV
jgi:hypothetical protein